MSKQEAIYEQWAKNSRENEAKFMRNIAERLGRDKSAAPPEHPFKGAPDYWREYDLSSDERISLFMENWKKVGGEAHRFANMEEAADFIVNLAEKMKAQRFIRQDLPELAGLNLEERVSDAEMTVWNGDRDPMLAKVAQADMGIVIAEHAVAYTGSIVVKSSETKGRSVSLLPTICMAIVPAQNVRTRLGEVMKHVSEVDAQIMPAGIHFISGPSRSADIENDLTIGVHGPGIVFALIVDQL
jgi:L-lactate dehydrogenase complex protein LldG